jgi:hypothetical protein
VSIIACTGDWTGGWDNTPPGGADRFITEDLQRGRMVDVIRRGEPALMLAHWTGIYWNGQELGFTIFREVVRRLEARFDNLLWMKLSDVARYWAAKELTTIARDERGLAFQAPFACPAFTVRTASDAGRTNPRVSTSGSAMPLRQVNRPLEVSSGYWVRAGAEDTFCIDLPKGTSRLDWSL